MPTSPFDYSPFPPMGINFLAPVQTEDQRDAIQAKEGDCVMVTSGNVIYVYAQGAWRPFSAPPTEAVAFIRLDQMPAPQADQKPKKPRPQKVPSPVHEPNRKIEPE